MKPEQPIVICLTPVKNEAWILESFLKATSQWADRIIIADQNSTDRSREIASEFPKVHIIENRLDSYDEENRQLLLLTEARKIAGKKLIVTLDSDEIFTPGFQDTNDWHHIVRSPEGSVFGFRWINVLPGFKKGWYSEGYFPWVFMDNGSKHTGTKMHSPRIPVSTGTKINPVNDFHVLHLQYTDWNRMKSKQRYYQCLERIKYPEIPPVTLYRKYHHMNSIDRRNLVSLKEDWIDENTRRGIRNQTLVKGNSYWFDAEVQQFIDKEGAERFKRDAIWERKWNTRDPRGIFDKIIQFYWKITQSFHNNRIILKIDRFLKFHYTGS